ncbi:hypothetical protein [Streptomyces aquilus]|uniref:hypothetical protein n=1 Tax=Streptomyces aquilus TaxID=2548456 RepID=UPI0024497DCB|nr:hypothetical protein [Streptomyces aquilus]
MSPCRAPSVLGNETRVLVWGLVAAFGLTALLTANPKAAATGEAAPAGTVNRLAPPPSTGQDAARSPRCPTVRPGRPG